MFEKGKDKIKFRVKATRSRLEYIKICRRVATFYWDYTCNMYRVRKNDEILGFVFPSLGTLRLLPICVIARVNEYLGRNLRDFRGHPSPTGTVSHFCCTWAASSRPRSPALTPFSCTSPGIRKNWYGETPGEKITGLVVSASFLTTSCRVWQLELELTFANKSSIQRQPVKQYRRLRFSPGICTFA